MSLPARKRYVKKPPFSRLPCAGFQHDNGFLCCYAPGYVNEPSPGFHILQYMHITLTWSSSRVLQNIGFVDISFIADRSHNGKVHDMPHSPEHSGGIDSRLGNQPDISLAQVTDHADRLNHVMVCVDNTGTVRPTNLQLCFPPAAGVLFRHPSRSHRFRQIPPTR